MQKHAEAEAVTPFTLHFSVDGPTGPFHPYDTNFTNVPLNSTGFSMQNWNPAPHLMPDGSVRVMVHTLTAPWAGESVAHASTWRGPYTFLTGNLDYCEKCEEDPFMWTDKRGNWHVLYHRMFDPIGVGGERDPSPIPTPGWSGGHAFSRDGLNFSTITRAYSTYVALHNGTTVNMVRRERPKLVFGPGGDPEFLSNGVEVAKGRTYTLVVPLKTNA